MFESAAGAENNLATAAREYQSANFDAALAALDRAAPSSSPTPESLNLRGLIYLEQEKFDDAKKAFEDAHNANPSLFAPRIHLADLWLRQKKFVEARQIYQTLLKETNILMSSERLRFAILLTYLGQHNDANAQKALQSIPFPTETPAYYYAQAAWAFAHDKESEAQDWIHQAGKIYKPAAAAWFAHHLYHFSWLKTKPALPADQL
jgi:Tfp pilus assembly protein PilF